MYTKISMVTAKDGRTFDECVLMDIFAPVRKRSAGIALQQAHEPAEWQINEPTVNVDEQRRSSRNVAAKTA